MQDLHIKQIAVSHFRGIPGKLEISFVDRNNKKPPSILLVGDNGTGKSSIVDAIEFALQGHIEQSKFARGTRRKYSIRSLSSEALPEVEVHLSDESSVHRFIMEDDQGMLVNSVNPHPSFSVSPFVIRRKDILRFWDTPETERQLVFWNYLRQSGSCEWKELLPEQLKRLQSEKVEYRVERDRLRLEVAQKLNISVEDLPSTPKALNNIIEKRLYLGFNAEILRQKGVRINHKIDVHELKELVAQLIDVTRKHSDLRSQIKSFSLSREVKEFPKHLLTEMNDFLKGVEDRLTASFKKVSTINFVEKFICSYSQAGTFSLLIEVQLDNGQCCLPQNIFSEANLDLLALLFFVSLAEESYSRGQAPFLILDDVLQSIDSTIRFDFMSYLFNKLPGWQFVITVHDRLWQSQLRELLGRCKFPSLEYEIYRWSFHDGPKIRPTSSVIGASLRRAVEEANIVQICSEASLLLEQACNQLSVNLPISVIRRRQDRYTIGDLWPGIRKILSETNLSEAVSNVDKWLHLRNLIGAHYNEWARSLSQADAEAFAEAVLDFTSSVYCLSCFHWVESIDRKNTVWKCRCKAEEKGLAISRK